MFLVQKEFILLKSKLAKHLENQQDSIRFYPLCASCVEKVETVGGPLPNEDILFIICRASGLREVVALSFLSIASRKCTQAHPSYCEWGWARAATMNNNFSCTENKYPLANTSFVRPVVLY